MNTWDEILEKSHRENMRTCAFLLIAVLGLLTLHFLYLEPQAQEAVTAGQQTMDKLMRGEEVSIANLRLITPVTAAQQTEAWCIQHKVPKDQQVAIINRAVEALGKSKVRLCEPILTSDTAKYAKTEQ